MLSRLATVGAGVATLATVATMASSSTMCARPVAVPLASSLNRPKRPTTVLVHGLDSAKDTWTSVVSDLAKSDYPALSLDLRGHGESPMGDPEDFSSATLAADIRDAVQAHGVSTPFVLVGHSMGGRVVMRYAADYPEDLAALVIEDMDLTPRKYACPTDAQLGRIFTFKRSCGPTFEQCKASLGMFGYTAERIEGWGKYGRVFQRADGSFWSNINPLAQHLALKHVLATEDGREAFRTLSAHTNPNTGAFSFPCHLFAAGKGSAAAKHGPDGIEGMQSIMPQLIVSHFPDAWHSIHNSAKEKFVTLLKDIVDKSESANSSSRL